MTRAWSTIFPIALLPLIFHWMPLWRRNGIWFGVTAAPGYEDCPQARTVLHSYRIAIWLLALAAFAYARRQTLPHAVRPTPLRTASLASAPERLPGGIAAALVPFAVLT